MMARQHVAFGTALYVTTVGAASHFDVANMGSWPGAQPLPLLLSSFVVALGCLVPDLDHPGATLSKKLGPFRKPVTGVICALSGGHRGGMHSIFLPILLGLTVFFANLSDAAICVVLALSALIVTKFLLPSGVRLAAWGPGAVALALVLALLYVPGAGEGHWLVVAAVAGPLLHDLGDLLTDGKLGLLWPFLPKFAIFPKAMRFPTGGWFEKRLLGKVFAAWVLLAAFLVILAPAARTTLGA